MAPAEIEEFHAAYYGRMVRDVQREIKWQEDHPNDVAGNMLCALALVVYTEVLGRLHWADGVPRCADRDRAEERDSLARVGWCLIRPRTNAAPSRSALSPLNFGPLSVPTRLAGLPSRRVTPWPTASASLLQSFRAWKHTHRRGTRAFVFKSWSSSRCDASAPPHRRQAAP